MIKPNITLDDILADADAYSDRLPDAKSYRAHITYNGPAPTYTFIDVTVPGIKSQESAALLVEFGQLIRTSDGFAIEYGADWIELAKDQVRARKLNAYGRRRAKAGRGVTGMNWDTDLDIADPKARKLLVGPFRHHHERIEVDD